MLIPFWFGRIHIGRTSGIGDKFDAAITLCWRRRDAEPEEPQWRLVMRLAWNWLPICKHESLLPLREAPADRAAQLSSAISGRPAAPALVPAPGIDSSIWTGRSERFVGFGAWPHELKILKSDWRSKMRVYLTGSKEKANPNHVLYVAPASHLGKHMTKAEVPAEWLDDNKKPKTFAISFAYGVANVDDKLGEWLIATGHAQRTNLIRARGNSLLGGLAKTIAGH